MLTGNWFCTVQLMVEAVVVQGWLWSRVPCQGYMPRQKKSGKGVEVWNSKMKKNRDAEEIVIKCVAHCKVWLQQKAKLSMMAGLKRCE